MKNVSTREDDEEHLEYLRFKREGVKDLYNGKA